MNQPAPDQPNDTRRDISTGGGAYNEGMTNNNDGLNFSGGTARDINASNKHKATFTTNNSGSSSMKLHHFRPARQSSA